MKFWIAFTDGDNCDPTITSHHTREEAEARVRGCLPDAEQDAGPGETLRYAWESVMQGACIIEEHELRHPSADRDKVIMHCLRPLRASVPDLHYQDAWSRIEAALQDSFDLGFTAAGGKVIPL